VSRYARSRRSPRSRPDDRATAQSGDPWGLHQEAHPGHGSGSKARARLDLCGLNDRHRAVASHLAVHEPEHDARDAPARPDEQTFHIFGCCENEVGDALRDAEAVVRASNRLIGRPAGGCSSRRGGPEGRPGRCRAWSCSASSVLACQRLGVADVAGLVSRFHTSGHWMVLDERRG